MDTPLRSKLLTVLLLRRASGSLLRNPCPPSGPLEGWGPQAKRSGRDGAKRKVSGGRAAVRLAEGWTYAQRESSRPSGGRVNIRSAEEQPSARRKCCRLSGQGCRLAGCGPGCEPGCGPGCRPGRGPRRRPGRGPGCRPAVRAENENRAALLVRPALIFGWLHLSQQMCVLKVVISSPHRTLHTSHI